MTHPPAHTSPASLRIGVYSAPTDRPEYRRLAPLLALVLRAYGQHRVLGYRREASRLVGSPDGQRWVQEPVADAPDVKALVRHCDLIYLFDPLSVPELTLVARRSGTHPTLALATPLNLAEIRRAIRWSHGQCPVVYQPLPAALTVDMLASPTQIWVATESVASCRPVDLAWRPIINTVPVTTVTLSEVSETGLVLPPEPSGAPTGVGAPFVSPGLAERPEDAAGR